MKPIERSRRSHLKTGLPQLDARRHRARARAGQGDLGSKEEIKGKPKETERERVQVFEGIVIGLRGDGARATMTVRKVSFGTGRRAHLPAAREERREDRGGEAPPRAPGQALLPARAQGQGRPHEGKAQRGVGATAPFRRRTGSLVLRHALRGGGAGRRLPGGGRRGRGRPRGAVRAGGGGRGDPGRRLRHRGARRLQAAHRAQRERWRRACASARPPGRWAAPVAEIDRFNILHATYLAMRRALERLAAPPDLILVDALTVPRIAARQRPIVKRRRAVGLHRRRLDRGEGHARRHDAGVDGGYPGYGLASNMGYGSRDHREALRRMGPSEIHRRSFHGTQRWLF